MNINCFVAKSGKRFRLKDYDPRYTGGLTKKKAKKKLKALTEEIGEAQNMLFAQKNRGALFIFLGLNGSGKDSVIGHVFTDVHPMGIRAVGFKAPTNRELGHDYLWREIIELPERGMFAAFNRSYYEEVTIVRVRPELLEKQNLPPELKDKNIWKRRFREISNLEKFLSDNGFVVLKFFINTSGKERRQRLLERTEIPKKLCKFSIQDAKELKYDKALKKSIEATIANTSTRENRWYVVPGDNQWFTWYTTALIIAKRLRKLGLKYPELTPEKKKEIGKARKLLKQN